MGRGFISGVFWASVVSIVGLGLLAQLGDMIGVMSKPDTSVAEQAEQTTPTNTEIVVQAIDSEGSGAVGSVPDGAETAQQAPPPQTGDAVASLKDPVAGNSPLAPTSGQVRAPIKPGADRSLVPQSDSKPSVGGAPALPKVAASAQNLVTSPATDTRSVAPAAGSAVVASGEPGAPRAPQKEAPPIVDFSKPQIVNPPTDSSVNALRPPAGQAADTAIKPNSEAAIAPGASPSAIAGPAREVLPVPTPAPEPTPAPVIVQEAAPKDAPTENEPARDVAGNGGSLLKPVTGIGDRAANVQTNRLPSIGEATPDGAAKPAQPEVTAEVTDAPAIKQFAAEFENPEGRPLMAILLLSDAADADAATDATLPFPVSYVVDASKANAPDLMRRYRDGGNEVVVLTPLPEGAAPVDVEVAFLSYLSAVPEAVAVMDVPAGAFQAGRGLATQVAQALAASGHGMITYKRGLNSAIQVAEREGVPAALVFSDIDGIGQNGAAIKRFIDRAAFRAGQQGGVILVGRNRPETIKALLEWGLGNRANTVALAPISVVLQAK
ncbi:MAG: divergent polysaccharide deacetylase family protein [Marinosulfonomonas sp.]|nr:divergent polysaccharide deacetylase family protein [Marinosulfonomonas sp.]